MDITFNNITHFARILGHISFLVCDVINKGDRGEETGALISKITR